MHLSIFCSINPTIIHLIYLIIIVHKLLIFRLFSLFVVLEYLTIFYQFNNFKIIIFILVKIR